MPSTGRGNAALDRVRTGRGPGAGMTHSRSGRALNDRPPTGLWNFALDRAPTGLRNSPQPPHVFAFDFPAFTQFCRQRHEQSFFMRNYDAPHHAATKNLASAAGRTDATQERPKGYPIPHACYNLLMMFKIRLHKARIGIQRLGPSSPKHLGYI